MVQTKIAFTEGQSSQEDYNTIDREIARENFLSLVRSKVRLNTEEVRDWQESFESKATSDIRKRLIMAKENFFKALAELEVIEAGEKELKKRRFDDLNCSNCPGEEIPFCELPGVCQRCLQIREEAYRG